MKLSLIFGAASGIAFIVGVPCLTHAQEVAPAATHAALAVEKTTSEATGPSMPMVGSGIAILALSYGPAVIVATTSGLGADRSLYVPLAGPWIDLTQRPGCPSGGSCDGETTSKVLLVTDGVFQGIGAITILGGFLDIAHETTTVRVAQSRSFVHLSPAQLGSGGYGLLASGAF
jgi:hypothetical protein